MIFEIGIGLREELGDGKKKMKKKDNSVRAKAKQKRKPAKRDREWLS